MRKKDAKTLLGKWDVLCSLSKEQTTPTAIAASIKKSLPHVSQQLKLLEALNLVKAEHTEASGSPGKPRTVYSLTNDLLLLASTNPVEQKVLKLQPISGLLANLILLDNQEDTLFLLKALLTKEEFFSKLRGLRLLKSGKESMELFVLTDALDEVRRKYSNFEITVQGHTRKIICWSHSLSELQDGLTRKDTYFQNLLSGTIVYDPHKELMQ